MSFHVSISDDDLCPASQVRHQFGISDMSLWRWLKDPALDFPAPIYINGRRYWRRGDLSAFTARQSLNREAA